MSNNFTGTNTMSKNSSSTAATATNSTAAAPKRVSKKADATPVAAPAAGAAVVAAPAPVAAVAAAASTAGAVDAPAVAEKPKKVKAEKPVEKAKEVVSAAPTASSVAEAAPVAEVKSVEQEISELVALHQKLRDQSVAAIKTLQKLQKRVAKEVKEAGRRRRAKKEDDGTPKEKRPTIFTTPVTLKDELCVFLGKAKGSQMTPADVTRAFSAYVDLHKLKDVEKGHTIHPDAAMRKVLNINDSEKISYRNVQSYLYKLYILPAKKDKSLPAQ
jgi:chromatin remodeling complex protein RSC6